MLAENFDVIDVATDGQQAIEKAGQLKPDVIVMSEVTWYVLGHLDEFRKFAATQLPDCLLMHLLTVYKAGDQQYGREFFTDLDGILRYFGMAYLESGQVNLPSGNARTWFLGTWAPAVARRWSEAV